MSKDLIKIQLKQHLEDILPSIWLEGHGDTEVNLKDNPALKGATDAFFYEAEAKIKFVIKFGLNDIPKEKEGYKILKNSYSDLARHLVPLLGEDKNIEDLGLNKAILLTPHINSLTLHDLVSKKVRSEEWIIKLYLDYLNELKMLWKKTRKSIKPDLENIYLKRLTSRLLEFKRGLNLDNGSDMQLILKNKEIKMEEETIPSIRKRIEKLREKVRYSCTIHGDEHAKNILIKKSNIGIDEKSWVLIDCGNALEQGDWIFSIAKILHWWKVYFTIENAKEKKDLHGYFKKISGDKIEVSYDEDTFEKRISPICHNLCKRTLDFCKKVNKEIFQEDDSAWQERLRIALFIILFGAVTRHLRPEKRFAIPFLIGESFKSLENL